MLGPSLLVAPVFVPQQEETEYYLPTGRWTSFYHPDRVIVGPTWVKEKVALDDIPLWVRPDSVLVLGPPGAKKPDYDYSKQVEVRIYELTDGHQVSIDVPGGTGTVIAGVIRVRRESANVHISVQSGKIEIESATVFANGGKHTGRKTLAANGNNVILVEIST